MRTLVEASSRPAFGGGPEGDSLSALPPVLGRLLGISALERLYAQAVTRDDGSFVERALDVLDVSWRVPAGDLANVPREGPAVVVANHPFGGLDALVLLAMLGRVRGDVRVLANRYLGAIGALRGQLFLVDPFGGAGAARRSVPALRAALRWLEGGGALLAFPAGEVASFQPIPGRVVEAKWSPVPLRLARRAHAPVVPAFVAGSNGPVFHAAGLLHPRLRTLLLPRELLRSTSRDVQVRVGAPVVVSDAEAVALARELRDRVLALGRPAAAPRTRPARIARPESRAHLAAELESLPSTAHLAEAGEWRVVLVRGHERPAVLRELGRLRELSFRGVGEGTGRARDLDRFDLTYGQLVLWNASRREIAGAYRLTTVGRDVPGRGVRGLYTSTLFSYEPSFFRRVGPSVELGRSFVRREYQRKSAPLALLWKGIGAFVKRHECTTLLGAVSMSARYPVRARNLVAAYLAERRRDAELASSVRPRNPVEMAGCHVARTAAELDALLRRPENGGRGLPVLVRRYLKLGAVFAGANVDPDFGDATDFLLVVDVGGMPEAFKRRYLGFAADDERLAAVATPGGPELHTDFTWRA
jgi:putative hemolysin